MTCSVEADVTPAFAWQFRTDVSTWDDPPAVFALEGAFETGSRGTTSLPGQEPLHWSLGEVNPGESFTIEMPLDRALLCFEWRFEELPGRADEADSEHYAVGRQRGHVRSTN